MSTVARCVRCHALTSYWQKAKAPKGKKRGETAGKELTKDEETVKRLKVGISLYHVTRPPR